MRLRNRASPPKGVVSCWATPIAHLPLCSGATRSTCSSLPGQAVARCAGGDEHVATAAAPAPSAAAQPTVRAWPAADELLTSEQRGRPAGPGKGQLGRQRGSE